MRYLCFFAFLAVLPLPVSASEGPSLEDGWYVDRDVCPVERCVYGNWTAKKDTVLYDRQRGKRRVGLARAGTPVAALTGDVYTMAFEIEVAHPITLEGEDAYVTETWEFVQGLKVGDRFYLLTDEGEGFTKAWIDGRLDSVHTGPMYRYGGEKDGFLPHLRRCDPPTNKCWWRSPQADMPRQGEWWVKIRLPDGTEGWTKEINFEGFRGPG